MAKVVKRLLNYVVELDEFVGQIAMDSETLYPLRSHRGVIMMDGTTRKVKTLVWPYVRPYHVYETVYVISCNGMPDEIWVGFVCLEEVQSNLATLWPMQKVKTITECETMFGLESMFEDEMEGGGE